jgi:outer membrane lipoprotein-sorting protein
VLVAVAMGAAIGVLPGAPRAADASWPAADEVIRRVNERDDGAAVARTLVMELIDEGGATRTRVTRSFRRDVAGERRSVLFFESPANLKGTALLTWDDPDPARDDLQWLYLPGLRKSRRVAMSERGRAFLGTDMSFEDMKNETRVSATDYRWSTVGEETVDGAHCLVLEGVPVDDATARELGYGRLRLRVDAETWVPRLAEYADVRGAPLKTVRLGDVRAVQGIWTSHRVEVENLQTGHRTRLEFRDVDYAPALPDDLFTEPALARGAP